ncbi:hypothetical protein [Deinococcus sp. PEB2-63]
MKNYRVKYRALGLLSSKEPGDTVKLDDADAAHLLDLGVIESEADYQERQAAKAEAETEDETEQSQDDGQAQALADENTKLKADLERLNAQVAQLKTDAKADAKKHADEVKGLKADVKAAQAERDAALAKIPKEGADAAGQPAGGE